ncbi:MAG TPA: hypothetical protein DCP28_26755, partial [Cytophagales bacterium]|nr:hypothetical protein [Cytophagales bacterium]
MKPSYTILLLVLWLAVATACTSTTAEVPRIQRAEEVIAYNLGQQLQWDLEDDNLHGAMSAALIKDGELLWTQAFGWVGPESSDRATDSTLFRIGSITKSFTAFLMLQLHEEGVIRLDDPIENYLPEVRQLRGYAQHAPFTFLQLASHTAGLQREPDWEEANRGPIGAWEEKLIEALAFTGFADAPGTQYRYSNIGYGILGLALGRAAQEPFIELVQRKIFDPLGMQHSYFVVPEEQMRHLARGLEGGPFGELRTDIPEEEHAGRGY